MSSLKKSTIPPGYCQCGCGEVTNVAKYSTFRQTKGKPVRFVHGHNYKRHPNHPAYRSRKVKIEGVWCQTVPLNAGMETIVSMEDYVWVCKYTWTAFPCNGKFYAARYDANGRIIKLHRAILSAPSGSLVDHRNGNGLDNRRSNLRVTDGSGNAANSTPKKRKNSKSVYKGVTQLPTGRWRVIVARDRHVGCFANEVDAAIAYDEAARSIYGEFACVNFPRNGERGCLGD